MTPKKPSEATHATFINTFRCKPDDQDEVVRINIDIIEQRCCPCTRICIRQGAPKHGRHDGVHLPPNGRHLTTSPPCNDLPSSAPSVTSSPVSSSSNPTNAPWPTSQTADGARTERGGPGSSGAVTAEAAECSRSGLWRYEIRATTHTVARDGSMCPAQVSAPGRSRPKLQRLPSRSRAL